ncbi:MAG: lysylphosphatidylglycerol synthase domain-containing protein [Myxococcota bacterium]
MMWIKRLLQWIVPPAVSAGLLWYLLSQYDMSRTAGQVDLHVLAVFLPSLVAYGAFSLWIEAVSLVRLLPESHTRHFGEWTAARVKAASYPLYILNYALGAGALAVLLRRRAGLSISDASGLVILMSLFDMGMLLVLAGLSATLLTTGADDIPVLWIGGAGAALTAGLLGGFALLRTPRPLGPLERLRNLELFRAARTTEPRKLVELGLLRLVFVLSFMSVAWAALMAFEVSVPFIDAMVNIAIVAMIATLPIAVAGLGTSQAAFLYCFRHWADEETLLACSLVLSFGLILLRGGLGLIFSGEFAREALQAVRGEHEPA